MTRALRSSLLALPLVLAIASCGSDSTSTAPPDTTPPAVTSVTAVDLFHVDVTFNEAVQRASAEQSSNYIIRILPPAMATDTLTIAFATLGTDQRTVTLSTWAMGPAEYSIGIAGVKDASGNAIQTPVVTTFNGTDAADTTPPVLVDRSPTPGATGVGVGQPVTLRFSEVVDLTAGGSDPEWVVTGGGGPVSFQTEQVGYAEFALVQDAPLAAGTQYTVTLNGVLDAGGNPMPGTSWSFTTTNQTDTTPPTIVSTVPANNATNVSISGDFKITFSEPINQSVFEAQLTPDPGDGTVSWSNGGKTLTFDPDAPLLANQVYTLAVLPGAYQDLAGNKNTQLYTVIFSTGATLPAGSFAGTLTGHPGSAAADPTGALVVATTALVFDEGAFDILGSAVVKANDTYDILHLPDTVYYPFAIKDVNGDNDLDPSTGDAVGIYGVNFLTNDFEPDSVTISGGNRVTGVDFVLTDLSAITGTVSYTGTYAGDFYTLIIALFDTTAFSPTNFPVRYSMQSWPYDTSFRFNALDNALADGTYYVGAILDVNNSVAYEPGVDPVGLYGGIDTPIPVHIANGSDALGLNVSMTDPAPGTRASAATTGPRLPPPVHRAPWLAKLAEAIHRDAAMPRPQ
ncbi:MAG TPA: Ig-like domain-containing protein [Candidatus Krumholzibacteria bacterium]|nr:Ig-like domain-containing protein [Candidatus Krumholzibacteria bacterium]